MADFTTCYGRPLRHLSYKAKGDKYIWSCVIMLALASVLVVYSATGSLAYKMYKGNTEVYLFKQLSFITIGLLVIYFYIASTTPYFQGWH